MSEVVYVSEAAPVHMGDEWFEISNPEHFYIKRRFEVLAKMARKLVFAGKKLGEIGCGYGVVQRQFESRYGVKVDGFDLHAEALRGSQAEGHARFCYNVFDRDTRFAEQYDMMVMFDVLEHIEEEVPFLKAVLYHLKPGGQVLINVPALMTFYSAYDRAVGHQRRYTKRTLGAVCSAAGLKEVELSYWGLPLIPVLLLRNLLASRETDPKRIIQRGYKPPGRLANQILGGWSVLEPIPQRLVGTSLMGIYRKE